MKQTTGMQVHPFLNTPLITVLTGLMMLVIGALAQADYRKLEGIVAIVEDNVILQSELDERIQTIRTDIIRTGRSMPPDEVLQSQILEQLITESIQLQLAERNGIRVSDSNLNDTMEKIAAQNGKSLGEFKQAIEEDGMTYKQVRESVRKDLIMSRLRQKMVANRINITEQDVKNYLNSPEGKATLSASYRLGHILLDSEKDAKALSQALKGGKDFFKAASAYGQPQDLGLRKVDQLPTLFADVAQSLQPGESSEPINSASGWHLIQLLEKQGGDHKLVQQTKVRHILIKPNEIRSKENARQMIDDIRLQILTEKSFGEMARTYSEDPISASAGGDLGWATEGDFVPEFEEVMANTDIGELSKPFYTSFGWHILEVVDRRTHNMGKEFLLDQARGILQQRQFEDEVRLWLREIRQNAFVDIKLPGYQNMSPDIVSDSPSS